MSQEQLADAMQQTMVRQMVSDLAIQELIALLPNESKKLFAERLRAGVIDLMQNNSPHLSAGSDEQITLATAAMLEAAGHAPKM